MNAVIGHTGFIGSILKKDISGDYFNRENINSLCNKSYNIVYCAGVSAIKWYANKHPEEDKKNIDDLFRNLINLKCKKFVLISTISIYDNEPYGINRKNFEDDLIKIFKDRLLIVRLPAVFGDGIKKNLLFDILNNSLISKINIKDKYQWYNVNNIKFDIDKFLDSDKQIVELYPEPITNKELISIFSKEIDIIDDEKNSYIQNRIPKEGYFYSSDKVINELKKFINGYR